MSNKIIGIVAIGPQGLIGINNKMPWSVPEDLNKFKVITTNNVVIMGRKTWESLNKKCLPNRINYVISKSGNFDLVANTAAVCFCDIDNAINDAQLNYPDKNIFIMGGGSIYKQTLPIWDELYLTIISKDKIIYEQGDYTFFDLDYSKFNEVESLITEHATYKKLIRKVTNSKTKNKLF